MWDNMDDNWIAESIRQETCIAITDGSYMRTLYPDIHSAAFILAQIEQEGCGTLFLNRADALAATEGSWSA
jgi:hypothetical protein